MSKNMSASGSAKCVCEIFKNNKSFEMPRQLLNAFRMGDVVIFAGAGVSTESKAVLPYTFYAEVARALDIDPKNGPSFPDLMSALCDRPSGRQEMLLKLKAWFNYIRSFGELYRDATAFHRQLSTIHQVENIVTTNWDDYFESECAATPYVSAEDFALWRLPGRKVFKIHGSINSLGSIVATKEDYERCYERLSHGLMGSQLKTMLATNTIVYIGYSFSDFDFIKIHEILTSEMRGMRPHSYMITLDEGAKGKFGSLNITPIITAGAHFLACIKEHLVRDDCLLTDKIFDGLSEIYDFVSKVHSQICDIEMSRHPTTILTACYQDGLMHALERAISRRITGEYSCAAGLLSKLKGYEEIRKAKLREKNLTDVAYIDGYTNGLTLLLVPNDERFAVPVYYAYGQKDYPIDMRQYKKYLKGASQSHKSAFRWCERLIRNNPDAVPGIVFHHAPTLL